MAESAFHQTNDYLKTRVQFTPTPRSSTRDLGTRTAAARAVTSEPCVFSAARRSTSFAKGAPHV